MTKKWTEKDDELMRRLYPTCRLDSLAFRLGVTYGSLKYRAQKLELKREGYAKRKWTHRQQRYLINHYADTPMDVLVQKTGHKVDSIYNKAQNLGLKRGQDWYVTCGLNVSKTPRSVATRFQKGHVPANKGKRLEEFMSADGIKRSSRGGFQKGQKAHNVKPVGYERIDKDGYVFVKVEMGRKLVLKHRWVWEQAHGKIPKGHIIAFRDGNKQNCELKNLQMVSLYENVHRNCIDMTPEQRAARAAKAAQTRMKSIRRDKRRIHFGLEPLGNLVKRW